MKSASGGGPTYLPIETFGRVYMQADDGRPYAAGYDLIAHGIVDALNSAPSR